MLAIVVAVVAGLVVGGALIPFVNIIGAVLPAIGVAALVYVLLVRRTNALLKAEMGKVQGTLMNRQIDQALVLLEAIRARYSKWVPFLGAQIDGQIGSILFMKKDFDKARPYLERAFIRMWDAKLMLAVLLSGQIPDMKGKKKDLAAVDTLLEKVSAYSKKQGMLWSVWAYLHWKDGDDKKAIELLNRGKAILGEQDQVLSQNLLALQNDKKMKMKGYGDVWYQFHLETHPMVMQAQRGGGVRFARK